MQTIIVVLVIAAVVVGGYFIFRGRKPANSGGNGTRNTNTPTGKGNGGTSGVKPPPPPENGDIPGKDEFRRGKYKEAVQKLAAYVKGEGKDSAAAHYMLGRSQLETGQTAEGEKNLSRCIELDRDGSNGGAAAQCLGDSLFARYFAKVDDQDRTKWERIRSVYSVALRTSGYGPDRKQLIDRLEKLNDFLLRTKMLTKDSVMHTVVGGDNIEGIAVKYGLKRDCAKSISRINKLPKDVIRAGDKLKVIKPMQMELHVSKSALRLTAYLNGNYFGEFPVGIGKGGATPIGEFKVINKDRNPNWTQTLDDGSKVVRKFGDPKNILGTRWMGLNDKPEIGATGLGIHGTTEPKTVPGRESAGCVRMLNKDVELLFDFTPVDTKVLVRK
jgi:hypothetical protein